MTGKIKSGALDAGAGAEGAGRLIPPHAVPVFEIEQLELGDLVSVIV